MNEDEVGTLQLLHPQDAAGAHRALQYILRHLTANAKLLRHIGPILEQQHLEEYKRTFLTKIATKVVQDSHLLPSIMGSDTLALLAAMKQEFHLAEINEISQLNLTPIDPQQASSVFSACPHFADQPSAANGGQTVRRRRSSTIHRRLLQLWVDNYPSRYPESNAIMLYMDGMQREFNRKYPPPWRDCGRVPHQLLELRSKAYPVILDDLDAPTLRQFVQGILDPDVRHYVRTWNPEDLLTALTVAQGRTVQNLARRGYNLLTPEECQALTNEEAAQLTKARSPDIMRFKQIRQRLENRFFLLREIPLLLDSSVPDVGLPEELAHLG
ncbi:unnamed protein product [Sphagnum tenellum]